ncbi:MAG: hypothetical protein HC875_36935 [Anaerolineales bacterium]|nr:hypothetical protein [Anaerolineales bacterium]
MKTFGNCFAYLARPGMNARAKEQRRVNPALARLIGRCSIVRRLYRPTNAGSHDHEAKADFFRALQRPLPSQPDASASGYGW